MNQDQDGDQDQPAQPRRVHRCKTCDRVFARAEHLRRHCLSHENKKPNVCRACGSRFGRSDVLRRHMKNCAEHQRMIRALRDTDPNSEKGGQTTGYLAAEWRSPRWTRGSESAGSLDSIHHLATALGSPGPTEALVAAESRDIQDTVNPALMESSSTAVLTETTAMQDFMGTEDFDDLGFLEDILLPDMTMMPGYIGSAGSLNDRTLVPSTADDITLGRYDNRPHFPVFQDSEPKHAQDKSEPSYFEVLSTSNYEIEEFRKRLYCICPRERLNSFRSPSRSRILRCILAYFDHFDPHTPIIQHVKFSVSGTHPALVLMIMAIGAMYLSEHEFSAAAYDLARCLLENYPADGQADDESEFDFAPLQAMLLCIQFGVFSGEELHSRYSQQQFAILTEIIKDALPRLEIEKTAADQNWTRWSFVESFSRLAMWTCTLSAILLANDPSSPYMAPYQLREVPLPLAEELWRARSASRWSAASDRVRHHGEATLSSVADSLLRGGAIPEGLSSFALLSLVGWALAYICTQERISMSIGPGSLLGGDFHTKMDHVLSEWETYTRCRIKTDRAIYRLNDPLFTDCFPILASAYYHLYLGDELRALKAMAVRDSEPRSKGTRVAPGKLVTVGSPHVAHRAVLYAANSWLVRAKQGIGHFNDTGSINYGGNYLMTAYETALILSWWLSVVGYRPDAQDSRLGNQYPAIAKPVGEILAEAFDEVGDQGIPCEDSTSRALSPLLFTQRCMAKSIYPFCRQLERRIESFSRSIVQEGNRNEGSERV